jgi:hypothetical protein
MGTDGARRRGARRRLGLRSAHVRAREKGGSGVDTHGFHNLNKNVGRGEANILKVKFVSRLEN